MAEPVVAKTTDNKPSEAKKVEPTKGLKVDSWMYHKDHEPKLFKKGEEAPEGWIAENKWKWYKDIANNFQWRKK